MAVTNEVLESWRSTLVDGQALLAAYLASPEGQADTEVALLTQVNSGLVSGGKYLSLILAIRKARDAAATAATLKAQAIALATDLGLPTP